MSTNPKTSNTTLFNLLASQAEDADILGELEAHPGAVKELGELENDGEVYRGLPLHVAIWTGTSDVVVRALLDAHPEASKILIDGMTTLHWAAIANASEDTVRALLAEYPEAASQKDGGGWTPLHWAADKEDASEAVVGALLEVCPEAASKKDNGGRMPLHWAAKSNASDSMVWKALLDAFPGAATEGDGIFSPLHWAVRNNVSEAVVKVLLDACPDAADNFRPFDRHARSIESETVTVVTFVNKTDSPVTLYWLNFEGRKEEFEVIAPGETIEQHTFLTHPWTFEIGKKNEKNNNSNNRDYQEEEYEEKYGHIVVADDCRRVVFPGEVRGDSVGAGTTTTRVVLRKPALCKWSTQNHGKHFSRTFIDSTKAFLLCHHKLGIRPTRRIALDNCSSSESNNTKTKDEDNHDEAKGQQQLDDGKNSASGKITGTTGIINNHNSSCNKSARHLNTRDKNKNEEEEEVTAIGLGDLPAELVLKVIELSAPRIPLVLPLEPQQ